ncbi:MAG: hypothetical protein QM639_00125 [Rhodocyclaceae bacterium]
MRAQVAANTRLQWTLLALLAIACSWGVLWLDDLRSARSAQLIRVQQENTRLRAQAGDVATQMRWRESLVRAHAGVKERLWQFSSATAAQAAFGDWVSTQLKAAGAKDGRVAQPTFRHLDKAPAQSADTCEDTTCGLLELRASLRFGFDSPVLTHVLRGIEEADKLVRIEQMTVAPRDKRVEMVLVSLARLVPDAGAPAPVEPPLTESRAERAQTEAPLASKVVEVHW